ncbi:MAG: hypothetical protein ACRDNF_11985 [Streptosporangiaceae bacterium]
MGGLALTASLGAASPAAARAGSVTNLTGEPDAVSVVSASDAWATEGSNVMLHWNGTSWAQVVFPEYGTGTVLDGVTALSASDVWAVGDYGTSSLIEHWNGTSWAKVPSPSPGSGYGTFLEAVSATSASDAWAVGQYFAPGQILKGLSLILHWNGTSWTRVASPNPGDPETKDLDLAGLTSLSPSDAWVAGSYGTSAGQARTLVLHWNGTKWTRVASPDPGTSENYLDGLSVVSASDIWAAGSYFPSGQPAQTLALHWDGTSWAQVATPDPGSGGSFLRGVAASSSSAAWAAGTYSVNQGAGERNLLLRWNGTSWSRVAVPDPGAALDQLTGVAAAGPADAWAVGWSVNSPTSLDKTVLLHWNGTSWGRY